MPNPFSVGPIQVPANWGEGSAPDDITTISVGDDGVIVETEDAPANENDESEDTGFYANLVDDVDEHELGRTIENLIQSIESDKRARDPWLEDRAEAIKLLGLKLENPTASLGTSSGSAEGMSRIYDTLLIEALLRFQANARGELLPSRGPVKVESTGEDTIQGDDFAAKLEKALNYYFTVGAPEYYPDTDRMFFMQGLGGSGFKKIYFCPMRRRPVSESVDAENLILPPSATDLWNCPRKTHVINMDPATLKRLQILGVYKNVDFGAQASSEADPAKLAKEEASGIKSEVQRPEDMDQTVWECYTNLDLPGFEDEENNKNTGLPLPYKVTIHKDTRTCIEVRRNWKESDPDKKEKKVFVKYPFVEALSIYGIGLSHILSNTSRALTAMERISIDSGMFANFPGFIYEKGAARQLTNEFRVPPGGGVPVDGQGKDLRQIFVPMPYKDVSANFIAVIAALREQGQRVGGTAELPVGEGRQDAPVGTTLALLEQATKVVDAVHKRMHAAQAEEFQLMKELFLEDPEALWRHSPEETETWDKPSIIEALKRCDIVPQADPNTPSQMHRLMKGQAVVQLANGAPDLMDRRKSYDYALRQLGIGDPDDLFLPIQAGAQQPNPAVMAKLGQIQVTQQTAQAKTALSAAQLQQKEQSELRQHQLEAEKLRQTGLDTQGRVATDLQRTQIDAQTKLATNAADNQTALAISGAEIEDGRKTDLRTGTGISPGP